VDRTALFTQTAAYTGFRIVETRDQFPFDLTHIQCGEGTARDTYFTSDTVLRPDVRLGPEVSLDPLGLSALFIADGAVRASPAADSAFYAQSNVYAVGLFLFAARGSLGTDSRAGAAAFAFLLDNPVGHLLSSLQSIVMP
jgi:hypothetical protein